jgi:hypothetical protein
MNRQEVVCPIFTYYPSVRMAGLSQDTRSPGRDSNPVPPEFKIRTLTTFLKTIS